MLQRLPDVLQSVAYNFLYDIQASKVACSRAWAVPASWSSEPDAARSLSQARICLSCSVSRLQGQVQAQQLHSGLYQSLELLKLTTKYLDMCSGTGR